MDDGTNLDLVDISPIGSPDHAQITIEQQWRGGDPYSDDEAEEAANVAVDFEYDRGSPQLLPYLRGGLFRRLKPLNLDTNLSPPFLCSPGYPSTIDGTPSPLSYTSDYFDPDDESPSPPTKSDDNIWFHHYPDILIYVRKITPSNPTTNLYPQL